MNPPTSESPCPDVKVLSQLSDGTLTADVESALIQHLDECPRCQQLLEQESSDFVDAIPEMVRQSQDDAPLFRRTLEEIKRGGMDQETRIPTVTLRKAVYADVLPWLEASDEDDVIGELDHYRLTRFLGRGGMGIVFQARDLTLNREVALKVLSPSFVPDEAARARFHREARAAAAINHPNVVTIHSVSGDNELPYLVMECVEGQSLEQRLGEGEQIPTEKIVEIAEGLLRGLAAAHKCGVVHRDLKPANILLNLKDDQVKLTDFGLSQVLGEARITRSGTLMGTPSYIAPELIESSNQADHRADLFSLGSVLYVLCTGELAFQADSILSTLQQVVAAKPKPVREINSEIPAWLSAIVSRLHALDPADRFQSAEEVLGALSSRTVALDVAPVQSRRENVKRGPRMELPKRSTNTFWIWIAVSVTVLLVGFGLQQISSPAHPTGILVQSADGSIRSFESLGDAINNALPRSIITIHDVGPHRLPSIQLSGTPLRLTGAEGVCPVVEFDNQQEDAAALFSTDGKLELSRLAFHVFASPVAVANDDKNGPILVDGTTCQVSIDQCTIRLIHGGHCVRVKGNSSLHISNSEIHAVQTIVKFLPAASTCDLTITNCVLTADVALELHAPKKIKIKLAHNTVLASQLLSVYPEDIETELAAITVASKRNVFDTWEGVVEILDTADIADLINWTGEMNVYTSHILTADGVEEFTEPLSLDAMQNLPFVQETKSRQLSSPIKYATPRAELIDELWTPTGSTLESLRFRTVIVIDGNIIGADINTVGCK
ncbi:MAG: serine/threonine protein kinase [Pirellulaceae bacterium]|jgi:serine/threonine protein kinase